MRCLLGMIVAGGILLGQAAESRAQVSVTYGSGGRPTVSVGQPYAGYTQGYAPSYYRTPGYPYGYGSTSYYQQGYVYPGTTSYNSAYRGYYPAGSSYSRNNTTVYSPYGAAYPTYGGYSGYSPYGTSNYTGYAPYGYSRGVNVAPGYGGGTIIQTPVGTFRAR